jgi:formylglycine-generating enzyme required for sulfatase activity
LEEQIARLVEALRRIDPDAGVDEAADWIWLAASLWEKPADKPSSPEHQDKGVAPAHISLSTSPLPKPPGPSPPPRDTGGARGERETRRPGSVMAELRTSRSAQRRTAGGGGALPFGTPGGHGLPGALEITRALRPLIRRVPAPGLFQRLDEEGTIRRVIDSDLWVPLFCSQTRPWLDLALVVDESPSMRIWQETVRELKLLLSQLGAFRDLRTWSLRTHARDRDVTLHSHRAKAQRHHKELLSPAHDRLILIVSDCASPSWQGETLIGWLGDWGRHHPVGLLQVLPHQRLWSRGPLGRASRLAVSAPERAAPNARLRARPLSLDKPGRGSIVAPMPPLPMTTLAPGDLRPWARLVAGKGQEELTAFVLHTGSSPRMVRSLDPDWQVRYAAFRENASPIARRLACVLAAAPLRLPVIRLVQDAMKERDSLLRQADQTHLAEFFLSGLIRRSRPTPASSDALHPADTEDPELIDYDFLTPELRRRLLSDGLVTDAIEIQALVGEYVSRHLGAPNPFLAALQAGKTVKGAAMDTGGDPFAYVSREVLSWLGGPYEELSTEPAPGGATRIAAADASGMPDVRSSVPADVWFLRLEDYAYRGDQISHPPGVESGKLGAVPSPRELRRVDIAQRGCALCFQPEGADRAIQGSLLGRVAMLGPNVQVSPASGDKGVDFWEAGEPPIWATEWGWDEYGAWVGFSLEGKDGEPVVQRMRWIEPGRFQMGSPENEPGRWNDEGPRHEVTIREGFWLFDTPCTQALWAAVMGGNPSEFKSPDRPVEQVSWEEVQGFMQRLNARIPGLDLGLPSEAQWEHACRAGTETALYTGPIEILGANNAPALDPIAWYGGNSGVDFELEEGYDSSGWSEVQYPNPKSGTHPVKGKQPNAWGLYDMLGNVWEWCEDAWHEGYDGAPADGLAWESADAGADRVLRGGSWSDGARSCRCAFRDRVAPGVRYYNLGFRCARVQGREPGQQGEAAERANLVRPGPRSGEGRAAPDSARGAALTAGAAGHEQDRPSVLLRLDAGTEATAPLPEAPAILMRTDREQLTLRRMTEPDWASAIGRDRHGLWTEIAVEPSQGEPVIQRLRWIPPGRFTMGSPDDEPGRWGDEGPRHQVVLGTGYWLFDTPCTQALWEALLGENPSEFKSPERPVENVSWEDVQRRFLPALNERIPGFVLPSEAQWEYACRAGTETALYNGPIEILGDANAPALDPIAWYGGNSNQGFELENGKERTWLREMQYPGGKAGTNPVKGKQPNPWGLSDMLGNVWEWCEDTWHEGYDGAPVDGSARISDAAGADRVMRGGSWVNEARYCRCAFRDRFAPDDRYNNLGFRCARVQGS